MEPGERTENDARHLLEEGVELAGHLQYERAVSAFAEAASIASQV
jgi:hypothetical protein